MESAVGFHYSNIDCKDMCCRQLFFEKKGLFLDKERVVALLVVESFLDTLRISVAVTEHPDMRLDLHTDKFDSLPLDVIFEQLACFAQMNCGKAHAITFHAKTDDSVYD